MEACTCVPLRSHSYACICSMCIGRTHLPLPLAQYFKYLNLLRAETLWAFFYRRKWPKNNPFSSPPSPLSLSPPISFHGLSEEHHNYLAGQQRDSSVLGDRAILNCVLKPCERTPYCSIPSACQKLSLTTQPNTNTWKKHALKCDNKTNCVSVWETLTQFLLQWSCLPFSFSPLGQI